MKNFVRQLLPITFLNICVLVISSQAATFTVTNTNDAGAGSLRQAVLDANAAAGDDVIAFDGNFNVARTITLATSITVTGNGGLTVNGPGASLLTVSGNNAISVFHLSGLSSPSIGAIIFNNLTVSDGRFASGQTAGAGIGINNVVGSPSLINFTANNIVFRNNQGGGAEAAGAAISCSQFGTVAVNNSTFTDNRGSTINLGSGIGSCSATINGSSFSGNTGDGVINCCGNNTTVTVSVNNSVFYNNGNDISTATIDMSSGGGITMTNTTVANNRNSRAAVWIRNFSISSNTLTNVTIAGNSIPHATLGAGLEIGITVPVTIGNSIIANNFNASGADDVEIGGTGGTIISQGYNLFETVSGAGMISGNTTGNLIGVDPWLDGTPRNNGGATKTLALRPGSPAIDAGNPTTFPATDQRGITRPQDGDGTGGARSDIGAYERRLVDVVAPATFDYDGDGRADVSVFRPSTGIWYLSRSTAGFGATQWGNSSDKLAPADYDGDGKTDIAVWRESEGNFYILNSANNSVRVENFGLPGDVLTVGDWDGDGRADLSSYRVGAQSYFFFRGSLNNPSGGITYVPWGTTGDLPMRGDFDGDGKADAAVFRPSNNVWYIRNSSNGTITFDNWGLSTDKFVTADYDGDAKTDLAVFRNGVWYIKQSSNGQPQYVNFGLATDTLVPADYDGDGKADTAVFRNGVWYLNQTTSGFASSNFGLATDTPVPNAYLAP